MMLSAMIARPMSATVKAVARPKFRSFTSWKILIVATVLLGVNRKMTTESVVTARTNVVTNPTRSDPPSMGTITSRKPRRLDAPRLVAASSIESAVVKFIAEAKANGIAVLRPDINESDTDFSVVKVGENGSAKKVIRFGLGAVKGVGAKAIESVIAAREDGGPFVSLHDFCLRIRSQLVNRRVIESLVKCGAFDSVERNRARLMGALEDLVVDRSPVDLRELHLLTHLS